MRLIDSLGVHARYRPYAVAAVDAGRWLTWSALCERVAHTAAGLQALGLRPGERAGVLALNGVRYGKLAALGGHLGLDVSLTRQG